jgi:hypothetical protein
VTTSRTRYWTWGRRLEVIGYALGTFAGVVWSIDNVLEQDWLRLVVTVAVAVVAARGVWAVVRRGTPSSRAAEDRRWQEAQSARGAMTAGRIRALAEQHHLDVTTSSGQIALIKVLREEDPRLGLVDAKTLVDDLRRF